MELKFVVPNMEKTFGELEFGGELSVETVREGNREKAVSRTYSLYSSVQRADQISVTIPAIVGEKDFEDETMVTLIEPRITTEGYKIGENGFTNYVLHAADIVKEK